MSETNLAVELRSERGKGFARRLRRTGRIPGVVYGQGKDCVSIHLDPLALEQLIAASDAGVNTLIDLQGAPEVSGRTVLIKELQREPVYGGLLHADLFEIDLSARIRVSVPIHLTGSAAGVTMGGLIDHALRSLELDCLPQAIPDEIVVDVAELDLGQSIHVSDLELPEGVECHTQGDIPVVSVVAPRIEEEETPEEELLEGVEGEGEEGEAPAEGATEAKDAKEGSSDS